MASSGFTRELYEALVEGTRKATRTPLFEETNTSRYRTLWLISTSGGSILPCELAKALCVTTPRVTVILNELDKDGLIERSVSMDDRRKVNVTLTEEGKRAMEKRMEDATAWLSGLIDRAGEADSKATLRFFRELIAFEE